LALSSGRERGTLSSYLARLSRKERGEALFRVEEGGKALLSYSTRPSRRGMKSPPLLLDTAE